MRGQQSIFADIVEPIHVPTTTGGIGRSKELIEARNTRLLYRYYFYAQIKRRQYADIIALISQQFDLREFSIVIYLQRNSLQLKEIFRAKPTVRELERLYPWLKWDE